MIEIDLKKKFTIDEKREERMKLEKSKNAAKNIAVELLQNIYRIVVPFIQRTLMIVYLGMEYTGLGGLFTSILSLLSLAELGVGTAMIYSMYKPIAADDEKKILKLLNLYKKYYRIIGTVILTVGLLITPFLKFIIKSDTYPKNINIYILFLMTLFSTVLTYWLYAYKNSVLEAYQKNYIGTKVNLQVSVLFDIVQIIVIVMLHNYYLYLACSILRIICVNIYLAYKVDKIFPQYKKPSGKLGKEEELKIKSNVKDVFLNKIGEVLTNSFDGIVTSTFLGLTILAQYQNYLYIWTAVMAVAGIVFNATRSGIGNSLVYEKKDKIYNDLKTFTFIVFWIIAIMVSGFANLFQPFITTWVGKKNLLNNGVVVCLCIFAALRFYTYLLSTYKAAAGIWHADRFRPFVSGLLNLVLNIILVQFWGIYGVMLSTVVSLALIDIPWLIINVFNTVLKEYSAKMYLRSCLKYLSIASSSIFMAVLSCSFVELTGVLEVVVKLLLCMFVCNITMLILGFGLEEFKHSVAILKRIIKK